MAEYFDNKTFTDLRTKRVDGPINFNWGTGIPSGTAITSADTFSVRWRGRVLPKYGPSFAGGWWAGAWTGAYDGGITSCNGEGTMTFTFPGTSVALAGRTGSVCGFIEIYVDGVLKQTVDCYSPTETVSTLYQQSGLPAGDHVLMVKVLNAKNPSSTGYWTGIDKFVCDGGVNIDDEGIAYTFYTQADDGVQLWVNNRGSSIICDWSAKAITTERTSTPVKLGRAAYPIEFYYNKGTGNATAALYWSSPFEAKQLIPVQALFPNPSGAPITVSVEDSGCIYMGTDTTTQGSWKGVYGGDGYDVFCDASSYPAYATISVNGAGGYVWNGTTTDIRALQKAVLPDRVAACWWNNTGMDINLSFMDGQWHQVALYFLDWDNSGRQVRIEMVDSNGQVIDTQNLSALYYGKYVVYNLRGQIKIRLINTGNSSLTISGLFFGPAYSTPPTPGTIDVTGLGQPVSDGQSTPLVGNDTDFGIVAVGSTHDHVFTIANVGDMPLNLTGTPKVTVSGAQAGEFSVTSQPTSPVDGKGQTTFTVRFTPTALGVRTARLSIANDSDQVPYDFAISGGGQVAAPAFSPMGGLFGFAQSVTISSTTSGATIRYTTDGSTPTTTTGTVYSTPVSISANTTLKAIAYKTGMTNSTVTSDIYSIRCVAPLFGTAAGTYGSPQSVTMSSATAGATIRYTTDGSAPSPTNGTVYSSAVNISATTTLRAIAYKSGMVDSAVASGVYTIYDSTVVNFFHALYTGSRNDFTGNVGFEFTPTANITVTALGRPVAGTMNNNHAIKIWKASDQSLVATVTVTPTSPTDNLGYKYERLATAVTLSSGTVYRITSYETIGGDAWRGDGSVAYHSAIATISGAVFGSGDVCPGPNNTVANSGYVPPTFYIGAVAAPSFTPAAGVYGSAQSVTISSATSGATIRYTTDGSIPSQSNGTVYSTPVTISSTTTLKAIAYKAGLLDSVVASGTYTITATPPANFFTVLYTGSRNNFTGNVGFEFTPTTSLTVTALGRPVSGTMTQNHAIKIWKVSDQSVVASATVTPASTTDSLGYKCVTLTTPVTLYSGTVYRITSYETAGGDAWRDGGLVTNHSSIANISLSVYGSGDVYPSGIGGGPTDQAYVPPTFYASTTTAVATPTFSPAAGTYSTAQSVTISTTTSGATIRYTTDGSTPSPSNGTVYSTPVNITVTTPLKAIAYKSGMADSVVASGAYTITGTASNYFNVLYTGTRTDFTGNVGYEFTPTANLTVTALGRPVAGNMTQNHAVKIWKVSDQSLVASATVTPTSPTDSLGYKYVTLPTSVTLTSGTAYRITSYETINGDAWRDNASISNHQSTATISRSVYGYGDTYPGNISGGADLGYGPPTFFATP